mmetsp:Transcript_75890/g.214609  ORF Transcript_75890/g.214609 Transcript_75890/m.214609 type:complete len:341 (+) Transcript_75890:66-1088(+)
MAKLLSHHDRLHAHALLGATALLHFLFRIARLLAHCEDTLAPGAWSAALLAVHALLHATSFQFEVPRNRIYTAPMIWREFRAHNAIFAYRNLLGAVLGIWFPDWWWRSPISISSMAAKIALTLATCKAADVVTASIGDTEKRTTNAMPYPASMKPHQVQATKHYYAKAQFAAASLAVLGIPALAFASVLAIEVASFLMTLVRKGIIQRRTYHIVYAASLFIMLPAMVVSLHGMGGDVAMATFRAMIVTAFAVTLRMEQRMPKYSTWAASIVLGVLCAEVIAAHLNLHLVAWAGILWSSGDTVRVFVSGRAKVEQTREPAGKKVGEAQEPGDTVDEAYRGG